MHRWFSSVLSALALAALTGACHFNSAPNPPPTLQFYWPSGMVFVPHGGSDAGPPDGVLYVVNANFDRRFDNGSVVGLNLSTVGDGGPNDGLPAFGAPVASSGARQITTLNIDPTQSVAAIHDFGGLMAAAPLAGGAKRLFVPTRSEDHMVYALDAPPVDSPTAAPQLKCVVPLNSDGGTPVGNDCQRVGMTTMANLYVGNGLPRGPAPYGVAVSGDGTVYVTHLSNADSPVNSTLNPISYLIHFSAVAPQIDDSSFTPIGIGGGDSVVAGKRWAYTSGRYYDPIAYLVRMVDEGGNYLDPGVENAFKSLESRGIALSSDESRLYLVGRGPDMLLVCSILAPTANVPLVRPMYGVPLPEAPDQLAVIPRTGKTDLVAIASSTAGTLSFYDDAVGGLVGQVAGLGLQPFAIAVDPRDGASARLYVSNFADGRVAVIDLPDLNRPDQARLVAHLSGDQLCLTRGAAGGACDGGSN